MRRILLPLVFTTLAAAPLAAQAPDHFGSGEIHSSSEMSSTAAMTAAMRKPVTGAPFQGQKVTRSVWRLGDGTVITHESDTLMARDGEGRVREELQQTRSTSMGGKQDDTNLQSITIADPVDHSILMLMPKSKLAMKMNLPDISALGHKPRIGGIVGGLPLPPPAPRPLGAVRLGTTNPEVAAKLHHDTGDDVHTEDLGKQSIAGVLATGKRTTTVIPLGKIGNDRPITIVHEEWYSPDLQLVVKSFDSDPRDGERTMELEAVSRAEPDPALFKVPEGYTVKDMAEMMKSLSTLGHPKSETTPAN